MKYLYVRLACISFIIGVGVTVIVIVLLFSILGR
jgi:hypothetical protein